ncbi:unnamed protein product [Caenorhabditis nigoni]
MTSKKLLICFLIGFVLCPVFKAIQASNSKDSYVDRVCGEDQTNLWLDIVCVVDNSTGMTNAGLTEVAASISSLFVDGQQLGIQPNNPRTTRVGIVTYNQGAQVAADLNNFG